MEKSEKCVQEEEKKEREIWGGEVGGRTKRSLRKVGESSLLVPLDGWMHRDL